MTPGLLDEIVVIDLLALLLAVAMVEIIWYVVEKAFPDEVRDLQFFLTFIVVIVPFVMLIYFGLAIINYDAMTRSSGWEPALPLKGPLSPPIIGLIVFYIGLTVWLWSSWRRE
jgi:hypothetical protein